MERHPTTAHWTFPPADREPLPAPLERTNLRELEARPGRFEHHLMVVARVGVAQLEAATASEPLCFAHRNISDEYALPMTTGDQMVEMFPFRVFISDFDSGTDVARINHGVDQMVLHPHGFLHWSGRLRPPYETLKFAPGMRRCGYSVVFCASEPTPPGDRPLFVSPGREAGPKAYDPQAEVPFLLADLRREQPREVARVGDTCLELLVRPEHIAPARGGYLLVLSADPGAEHFPGDLIYVPAGATVEGAGMERALLMSSADASPEPPPRSWVETPPPPFPELEQTGATELPITVGPLTVDAMSLEAARLSLGDTVVAAPRYWIARMLFRIALHDYQVGYVETYGGFFYDDTGGRYRLGIRGGDSFDLDRAGIAEAVERLYRAVAPPKYTERLE